MVYKNFESVKIYLFKNAYNLPYLNSALSVLVIWKIFSHSTGEEYLLLISAEDQSGIFSHFQDIWSEKSASQIIETKMHSSVL